MKVEIEAETEEQRELLQIFATMLNGVSKDGGKKRAAGTKKSWKIDTSHEAAIFSHLNKWKHGEYFDPDSGQHPLVHLAWRALAIAYQQALDPGQAPDAADNKEDVPDTRRLRAHLGGGCGLAYDNLGTEGLLLDSDERHALWEKAHNPVDRRGRVSREERW